MKNIPIPSDTEYTKRLIEKVEDFTKRLRWRAFFFLNPDSRPSRTETYGFKSLRSPPPIQQLKKFEDDLLKLIEDVKFCATTSKFQNKLRVDSNKIRNEKNILLPADKTNNYYSVTPLQYEKLMKDSVTTTYKRTSTQSEHLINKESKTITDRLHLSDRIQVLAPKPAYITLKDHKENFRSHPICRLINPSKSEIGIISKQILDRINSEVQTATKVNQWKNTTAVINWFNKTETKQNSTFITFDVVNFYPSINRDLMDKAVAYAKKFTTITPSEIDIIYKAKDTLLFHNNDTWQKSTSNDLFDVTMGSYDGAETCELVGTYILSQISKIIPKENIGLYRDDGLAIVHAPPRIAESMKKNLCRKFKEIGLQITANANTTITDFLDVTLDLNKKEYKPYSKPGNQHLYIHVHSNHPTSITNSIPNSIQTRLSNISSNEEVFNNAKQEYNRSLKEAGHKANLNYKPTAKDATRNKDRTNRRKRNITWFNPPYSKHVKSNIGKKFLDLIDKNFPREHQLHKICNRNTLKISYSCMNNMANIVKAHNNKIIKNDSINRMETCNCRKKEECPLPGKCTVDNVVYEAKVATINTEKTYIGLTSNSFKTRYATHKASFLHTEKRHQTELSKYIWTLKDKNTPHTITWRIIRRAQPYSPLTNRCNLCLWEKFYIITAKSNNLNSRTELISTCRHKRKFLLSEYG